MHRSREHGDNQAGGMPARRSYAITVEFRLKPGCMDAFLTLVRDNAAASVREEAECSRFDVLVPRKIVGEFDADENAKRSSS